MGAESIQLDEFQIRQWLKTAPLDTIKDLLRAGKVILEMREEFEVKRPRKARSDRGKPRNGQQESMLP